MCAYAKMRKCPTIGFFLVHASNGVISITAFDSLSIQLWTVPQPKTFGEALHRSTLTVQFQQEFCSTVQQHRFVLASLAQCIHGVFLQTSDISQTQLRCICHHYLCRELSTCDHLTFQLEPSILRNDHFSFMLQRVDPHISGFVINKRKEVLSSP